MFDPNDEDELELFRQYEEEGESDPEQSENDSLDSEEEDKILSALHYGVNNDKELEKKRKAQRQEEEEALQKERNVVEQAPNNTEVATHIHFDEHTPESNHDFSASKLLNLDENDDSEESEDDDSEEEDSSDDSDDSDDSDSESEEEEEEEEEYDVNSRDENHDSDGSITDQLSTLQPTRYLDMREGVKRHVEDEETSEEERELNDELSRLIDDQSAQTRRRRPRTFAVLEEDKTQIVCRYCSLPDHEPKDCNICGQCGAPRHPTHICTGTDFCKRCKLRGHHAQECPNQPNRGSCSLCGRSTHIRESCPNVLHFYDKEVDSSIKHKSFCYNCSEKGHYGDECPTLPQRLKEMPSPFSKYSLHSAKKPAHKYAKHTTNHSRGETHSQARQYTERYPRQNTMIPSRSGVTIFDSPRHTGSNNWKNVNEGLPQPTRSGTVNISNDDFPRRSLPNPSSSGTISVERVVEIDHGRSGGNRYHGGYTPNHGQNRNDRNSGPPRGGRGGGRGGSRGSSRGSSRGGGRGSSRGGGGRGGRGGSHHRGGGSSYRGGYSH